MGRRLLAVLLVAVPLGGCGSGTAARQLAGPLTAASAPREHVPVVSAKKLIRRAERMCRRWTDQSATLHPPVFDTSDPLRSLQRATVFARQVVVSGRRGYRRLHRLGVPRTRRARERWHRFMSQYGATIDHLDEIQAGVRVLDVAYASQSLRQLRKSAESATRRGHRLGLHACVD